jgi:hypothetical protein
MDIYKLLHEDHIKVKSLFKELEDTTEKALKTRQHLFANLKMELTIHAEAEENFFYPRLEQPKATHDITLEAIEEHKVVKTLLAQLEKEDMGTEEWTAKLTVLRENVEHHVKEEEEELFKKAKTILSKEDAEAIAEEVEFYKEEHSELESQG